MSSSMASALLRGLWKVWSPEFCCSVTMCKGGSLKGLVSQSPVHLSTQENIAAAQLNETRADERLWTEQGQDLCPSLADFEVSCRLCKDFFCLSKSVNPRTFSEACRCVRESIRAACFIACAPMQYWVWQCRFGYIFTSFPYLRPFRSDSEQASMDMVADSLPHLGQTGHDFCPSLNQGIPVPAATALLHHQCASRLALEIQLLLPAAAIPVLQGQA